MNTIIVKSTCCLSSLIGWLAARRAPRSLVQLALSLFARRYKVNLDEAEKPISSYQSFAEFFLRDLKGGIRPIGDGIVSPVDGTLRSFGEIVGDEILSIKSMNIELHRLLGLKTEEELAQRYRGGRYLNLYLSPRDYHHVHMPIDAELHSVTYLPGALWPVNDFMLSRKSDIFLENRRAVFHFQTAHGAMTLVMVGALNVGKILLPWDNQLAETFASSRLEKQFSSPISFSKGEKIGSFLLGSSVVLLFDAEHNALLQAPSDEEKTVVFGQGI